MLVECDLPFFEFDVLEDLGIRVWREVVGYVLWAQEVRSTHPGGVWMTFILWF